MTRGAHHKDTVTALHLALLWAKTYHWQWPGTGICGIVDKRLVFRGHGTTSCKALLDYLFEQWPEFSGRRNYPVCTVYMATGKEPHTQYCAAYVDRSMWEGEYGASRMRLLQFLIEQTRPE